MVLCRADKTDKLVSAILWVCNFGGRFTAMDLSAASGYIPSHRASTIKIAVYSKAAFALCAGLRVDTSIAEKTA